MLSVLADAMVKKVPLVRYRSVSVLNDGASVTDVLRRAGTGYIEYDAVVVSTMRNASRGLDRAKYVEMLRLNDLAGAAAAALESVEDASGGSGTSVPLNSSASTFNRFRRRCGGSAALLPVFSSGGTCDALVRGSATACASLAIALGL